MSHFHLPLPALVLATLVTVPPAFAAGVDLEAVDYAALVRQVAQAEAPDVPVYRVEAGYDGIEVLVQNRQEPSYVDRYRFDGSKLSGPKPVRFRSQPTARAVSYNCTPLDRTSLERLPEMFAETKRRLGLAGADIYLFKLERIADLGAKGFKESILWMIHASDGDEAGYVQFTVDGKYRGMAK